MPSKNNKPSSKQGVGAGSGDKENNSSNAKRPPDDAAIDLFSLLSSDDEDSVEFMGVTPGRISPGSLQKAPIPPLGVVQRFQENTVQHTKCFHRKTRAIEVCIDRTNGQGSGQRRDSRERLLEQSSSSLVPICVRQKVQDSS